MRLFWRILGIAVLIGLIYALLVGLGVTRSFKRHKTDKKTFVLDDFEYPNDDLDWWTGGYVNLESAKENQTHGKRSAKATFLIASQFYPVPTAGVSLAPAGVSLASTTPVPAPTAGVSWSPSITLSNNSVTKLNKYDWSEFTTLKLDVFNPQDQAVTYHLKVVDGRSFQHEQANILTPKKVTNISFPLEDLAKDRMDLSSIQSLTFWVDIGKAAKPVEIYLDYLRLDQEPASPKK
jgi:hypothetical protein